MKNEEMRRNLAGAMMVQRRAMSLKIQRITPKGRVKEKTFDVSPENLPKRGALWRVEEGLSSNR